MDKKNTILGLLCLGAGIGVMFWQAKELEKQRALEPAETPAAVEPSRSTAPADARLEAPEAGTNDVHDGSEMLDLLARDVDSVDPIVESEPRPMAPERTVTLANEFIEVEFTNRGGAIRTVEFLQTKPGERDNYVFNDNGHLPALSLSLAGRDGGIREFNLEYAIESQSAGAVTFLLETEDGLSIRREYSLSSGHNGEDPYIISHRTTFENGADAPKALSTIYLNLGTARPISETDQPNFLNVGYFDGEDDEFIEIKKLTGSSGFLGFGAHAAQSEMAVDSPRIEWASVKNQFFAAVLTSEQRGQDLHIYPVEAQADASVTSAGITGSVGYSVGTVGAGASETLDFKYYVGPKEFKRLQALGNEQDRVMQFGFLSTISKLLLSFMYAIHFFVPSWGWSIVIMTICIKLLFWPLTAKASRSQKRMAKIQAPMAELKEKYKDNPQKLQQETLKLFKSHQVNPVAGCLPMLIQMPIFLGLFYMLRTASELRHEPFLWVADLSQPDTLFHIAGFPINILPLIMGATMFLQMSMMPVSPTADPMQQKIFKFLPFIFLIFLYNFSSGLVLYWTVQNILTIIQQKIINSRPDEPLKPVVAGPNPASTGKGGNPRTKPRKKK